MRPVFALMLAGSAAQAFPCDFTTECREAEACAESTFALDVDVEAQAMSTQAGEITIVAIREQDALISIFGAGTGAEYMLSITPEAARFSAHMNDGPRAIQYLGTCEGAF